MASDSEALEIPIFVSKDDIRNFSRQQRRSGRRVALVPTMGYLHEGHLSLVQAARERADVVVASIYVNPTQFAKNEDFDIYPRDVDGDRGKLKAAGCSAIFEPASLYADVGGEEGNVVGRESSSLNAHETFVQVERLQLPLCGQSRPHFFRGVATVVAKLFNIVEPDVAVFGRKDYQQWRIITRMVRDLDFAVEVVGLPICREPDGLAMSSRNARLSPSARQDALCIHRALQWATQQVQQRWEQQQRQDELGGDAGAVVLEPRVIAAGVSEQIQAAGGNVDYVELRDADHLGEIQDVLAQHTLLAVAAHFPAKDRGTVRLIDNMVLGGRRSRP